MEDNKQENPSEEIDKIVRDIEVRVQSRPAYRFGVLVVGVAIGSYLGVGRHVVKLNRNVKATKDVVAVMGEFMATKTALHDVQANMFDQVFGSRKV